MNSNIFFLPWIGDKYGTQYSLFENKILLIGNSHYCGTCNTCGDSIKSPECTTFTTEIVDTYLDPEEKHSWKKTFSTFINSFFGHSTTYKERKDFFDSVSFYNYLQVSAGNNPYSTHNYNFDDRRHLLAFYEVLDKIKPNVVISWGDIVWNAIPNNWGDGEAIKGNKLTFDNKIFDSYLYYNYKNDTIMLVGAHHPSAGYNSDFYNKIFTELKVNFY